jgi:aminopeptidase-like protein
MIKDNRKSDFSPGSEGKGMYDLIRRLFDICRSITGNGVRTTLRIIRDYISGLTIHEMPSGARCFDWIIPDEWNIRDAYIMDEKGNKIIDFKNNNLHVVGYSIPVDKKISLEELQEHLFSLPENPDAIPYVTSYYKPFWGFCLTDYQRQKLTYPHYRVLIDSELKPGSLSYADLIIKGKSDREIFFSTYVCHPSMANNELSGPALATFLASWLNTRNNFYTYRFVYAPESIGPLAYLDSRIDLMREKTIAAFNLTCVGDDRAISFLSSKNGNTLTDRVARHVLKSHFPDYIEYSFFGNRASDERQYCSPGVDLPMVSIMRSKYGNYPEYHTSLDNLSVVCPEGLQKSFDIHKECILSLEANKTYRTSIIGEPQLVRHDLTEQFGGGRKPDHVRKTYLDILMYCDGTSDLISIADTIGLYVIDLLPFVKSLLDNNLIEEV